MLLKGRGQRMSKSNLELLRTRVDDLNLELLKLINERAQLVQEIGKAKESQGVYKYDPVRERKMLDVIKEHNDGPFDNATIDHLFKEIFKAGLDLQKMTIKRRF